LANGSFHVNLASQTPDSVLSNTHLSTSLTAALGKSGVAIPGGSLETACSGLKNLGERVAAMHVSRNLNIPFADLQSHMTGSVAVGPSKAIQQTGAAAVSAKADICAGESASATSSASRSRPFPGADVKRLPVPVECSRGVSSF